MREPVQNDPYAHDDFLNQAPHLAVDIKFGKN